MPPADSGANDDAPLFWYFNGLNSAVPEDYSGSAKIVAADHCARRNGYRFMPVSTDYRFARQVADRVSSSMTAGVEAMVFCGSSMGGWFARIMQLRLLAQRPDVRTATVAWNPAYDLAGHADLLTGPQQNYVTNEHYQWTASHSEALVRLERSVDWNLPAPWFVYVDRDDEVIAWEGSRSWHFERSLFMDFPGGCHSFDHYNEALRHFEINWLGANALQ